MKIYKFIYVALIMLGILIYVGSNAHAAPANNIIREFKQPSGEKFKGTLNGDEKFNWVTSETGEVLVRGDDKFWYYGEIRSGKLEIGTQKYKISSKPENAISQTEMLELIDESELNEYNYGSVADKSFFFRKSSLSSFSLNKSIISPRNNKENVLVLLVEFTDIKLKYSENTWSNLFFGFTGSTVNNYFKEVSNGRFSFVPASEKRGILNNGVIKVSLSYTHPDTAYDVDYVNKKIEEDALKAADSYIDYSIYDTNNNGYVESNELHIVTVIAGYEEAYGDGGIPSVWGHQWQSDDWLFLDNINIGNNYTQFGEQHGDHMATIGIICHEIGHDLGLPDLYDTDGTSQGIGVYSLMGSGSWGRVGNQPPGSSPTHLDPWSKISLGFSNPYTISSSGKYLASSISTNQYKIFKLETTNPDEYFLIENRQFAGYDASLSSYCKSPGVAIWHIDESVIREKIGRNEVNDNEYRRGIDLEEADEGVLGYSLLDRWYSYRIYNSLYYLGNNNIFNISSAPNSTLYDRSSSNISVTALGQISNSMLIDVKISTGETYIPVTSVKLNKEELGLFVKEEELLQAEVEPANASNNEVEWSSDNPQVASVDSTGKIRGISAGIANITVTTIEGGYTATCRVTVVNPVLVAKIVLKDRSIKLGVKAPYKMEYTITPDNAYNQKVTWKSSNNKIVEVNENGIITGKSKGTGYITVTTEDGSRTASCAVTVIPVEAIKIDKTILKLKPEAKVMLRASLSPLSAINKAVIWTTSDPDVVEVDEYGKISAVKDGEAEITAVSVENNDVYSVCRVVVETTPVTGIKINASRVTLSTSENNNTSKITAIIEPYNASNKYIIWESSNERVAQVDGEGNITAIAAGTAIITATTKSSGKKAICMVTVAPVKSIKLSREKLDLAVGSSTILRANILPANALIKGIIWGSDYTNKVIVTRHGKVIAVSPTNGEPVTVRARSVENGNIVGECGVTVRSVKEDIKVSDILLTNFKTGKNEGMLSVAKIGTIKAVLLGENKKSPTNKNIIWESSDETIIKVDDTGKVTAVKVGEATVTATAADGSGISESVRIEVVRPVTGQ